VNERTVEQGRKEYEGKEESEPNDKKERDT
jgi:hypothetical protein